MDLLATINWPVHSELKGKFQGTSVQEDKNTMMAVAMWRTHWRRTRVGVGQAVRSQLKDANRRCFELRVLQWYWWEWVNGWICNIISAQLLMNWVGEEGKWWELPLDLGGKGASMVGKRELKEDRPGGRQWIQLDTFNHTESYLIFWQLVWVSFRSGMSP